LFCELQLQFLSFWIGINLPNAIQNAKKTEDRMVRREGHKFSHEFLLIGWQTVEPFRQSDESPIGLPPWRVAQDVCASFDRRVSHNLLDGFDEFLLIHFLWPTFALSHEPAGAAGE
jgi:hypothetical protein